MRHASTRRRRAPAVLLAGAIGTAFVGLGGLTAHESAGAAPACRIEFNTSDKSPTVGENITLSWSSDGADQLLASWTTADVPAQGQQVTTKDSPGAASYQVTGLKDGQYCGGAAVNVVFLSKSQASTSAPPPTTSSPTTSAPTTSAPATTTSSAPSRTAEPTTPEPTSSAVSYPAQSPTSGDSVPWFTQPVNLAIVGVLSLFGSLSLFYRDRVRAVLLRRH